jgi:uncharacterized protein (TIGR03435 family)
MLQRILLLASFAAVPAATYAQQAPELRVSQWLQSPDGFTGKLSDLRGKIVVLEFWATWCEPCVSSIPHLNQLADEFRDKGIVFIAITDDGADRLTPFLAKRPMKAIIGIDTERENWDAFAVPSIPNTVLVGKDGRIIGATLPVNITTEVLQEALAGFSPSLPPKEGIPSDLEWDDHIEWQDGVRPAMYAIIKPIKTLTSGAWPRPGHVTADGVPLQVLVQLAYQTDSFHIDWHASSGKDSYRAAFRVPVGREKQLYPYMRDTLSNMFGIQTRWEEEARDVYVIRRKEGHSALPESNSDKELAEMLRGKIRLRHQPITKLCDMLVDAFSSIVVDETGMNGRYDFDIPYQPTQPEVISTALNELGLEAIKARRDVRILVVTSESTAFDAKPQNSLNHEQDRISK